MLEAKKIHDYHLLLIESISQVVNLFSSNRETKIHDILKILCLAFSASRAYIYFYNEDCTVALKSYEWNESGPSTNENIKISQYGWALNQLKINKAVLVDDIENMPEEANSEKLRLRELAIKSFINIPLIEEKNLLGNLGITITDDIRQWTVEEERILRIVAGMVAIFYQRKKADETLKSINAELEKNIEERTYQLNQEIIKCLNMKEGLEIANEKLEILNEELTQFAYIVSHDLQEPVRMVSNYLQLLSKRNKENLDKDSHEFLNYAVEGARKIHNMLIGILAYSRVDTRGNEFKKVDFNLLIKSLIYNLTSLIENNNAEVTWEDLPVIMGDEAQLSEMLESLISNSLKFCSKQPRIHISAEKKEQGYEFTVKDNGIGIKKEFHERIFKMFQRLHTPAEYPGEGIGLALCKKIISRHKGRIWLESEKGEGCTFKFYIPVI